MRELALLSFLAEACGMKVLAREVSLVVRVGALGSLMAAVREEELAELFRLEGDWLTAKHALWAALSEPLVLTEGSCCSALLVGVELVLLPKPPRLLTKLLLHAEGLLLLILLLEATSLLLERIVPTL